MSIQALHNTIRSRFKTKVEIGLSLKVQYDNAPLSKTDREVWCRFTIKPGDSVQGEFGGDTVKERVSGIAFAQLFCPPNIGDSGLLELADSIAGHFRRLTADDVCYLTPSVKNIGFNGTDYQVNVNIPFRYSVDTQKGSV